MNLKEKLRQFAHARDWEQFHTPKNLAAAITAESAELLEIFMWLTPEQSQNPNPKRLQEIKDEMGDIYILLTRLADVLNIDLHEAAYQKFSKVEEKYPIDKSLELTRTLQEP